MLNRRFFAVARLLAVMAFGLLAAGSAGAGMNSGTDLFPVPTGEYDSQGLILYPPPISILAKNIRMMNPTVSIPPPPPGGPFVVDSFFDIFFDVSLDGGGSWQPMVTGAQASMRITNTGGGGGGGAVLYDTEMLMLDIAGGGLPPGVMIRESPTLPSPGRHSIEPLAGGGFWIDSFFDVFTELSVDGGGTWMPQVQGPTRLELTPEPATLSLLALGGLGMLLRRRK